MHAPVVINDTSQANANVVLGIVIANSVLAFWFILFSGHAARVKYSSLVGAVALGAGLFGAVYMPTNSVERHNYAILVSREPDWLMDVPKPQSRFVDLRTTTEDDFPRFLGKERDGAVEHVRLERDWDKHPPRLIWKQEIGAGWSAFSVVNGFAVTMEQRGPLQLTTCYDVMTGQIRWSHSVENRHKEYDIGPRSTPTIYGGMVYTLGPSGRLFCLDGNTGESVWKRKLFDDFEIPGHVEYDEVLFGRSNSLLVTDNMVIVPIGGAPGKRVSLAAFDRKTGKLIWTGGDRQVSFSSPRRATLGDVDQILIVNADNISGHDVSTGKVLWDYDWPGESDYDASVSQAVPVAPNRVFVSKGYGRGAALFDLVPKEGGGFDTKTAWAKSKVLRTKFTNVVIWRDHVYGLSEGILECVELNTGNRVWKGGRYGHGQILRVNNMLLVLSDKGEVFLVDLSTEHANHVLGRFQGLDGKTWNNIAMYGKYLLIRNAREAACYELATVNDTRAPASSVAAKR